ncbi:hypothetical protein [Anthocerotibacter panamensis]|uniref:hypothetical protein n=1 Tax=Anthocerotibacter panamensis TaxID=2857077 RepID=UPI001C406E56|nr:hypothetical protein [Anthocerotibacter panamensis]
MSAAFREGMVAFEEGNYEEAGRLFELAALSEPNDLAVRIWQATTYQKLGNLNTALRIFLELAQSEDPVVRKVANRGVRECQGAGSSYAPPPPAYSDFVTSPPPPLTSYQTSWKPQVLKEPIARSRSVGDIISEGVTTYRLRFKDYAKAALVGNLWVFSITTVAGLSTRVVLSFTGLDVGFQQNTNPQVTLSASLVVLFLVGGAFTLALRPYMVFQGLVQQLTFDDLTQRNYDPVAAKALARAKGWTLYWASLLVASFFLLPYLVISILGIILITLSIVLLGFATSSAEIASSFGTLLVFATVVAGFLGSLVCIVRLQAAIPAIMVEDLGAWAAMRRSWALTKGAFGRSFGVLSLLTLLNGVVTIVPNLLFQTLASLLLQSLGITISDDLGRIGLTLLLNFPVLALTVLITPLWWTTLSVWYYDLRVRKEGLDLIQQLGDA